MSALHPNGAYIDPPLHHECMRFALQTCPYLISTKYTKRIDGGRWTQLRHLIICI